MGCSISCNPPSSLPSIIIPTARMRKLGAQTGEVTCPESHNKCEKQQGRLDVSVTI